MLENISVRESHAIVIRNLGRLTPTGGVNGYSSAMSRLQNHKQETVNFEPHTYAYVRIYTYIFVYIPIYLHIYLLICIITFKPFAMNVKVYK